MELYRFNRETFPNPMSAGAFKSFLHGLSDLVLSTVEHVRACDYRATWGERYVGLLGEYDYQDHSNLTHVDRLDGRVLLIHGELDDNVPASQTLRLADT